MPAAIDALSVRARTGTIYPPPLDEIVAGRVKRMLGNEFGLSQFGVNLTHLSPGAASAHRHWHTREDEFVYVLSGEVVLIDDDGETVMTPGMCAGFPAGVANGHHLVNRSDAEAVVLEVGTRSRDEVCEYPDVDMRFEMRDGQFAITRKDGSAFDTKN